MRPASAVARCAAAASVSGVRWSCQAESSSACISSHIIYPPSVSSSAGRQSSHHSSLSISAGDWLIMSCTDQEWAMHHCTHRSFHANKNLWTPVHTHTRTSYTNTHIKEYKKDNTFSVSVSCNSLAGRRHYLNVDAHGCTHTHTPEQDTSILRTPQWNNDASASRYHHDPPVRFTFKLCFYCMFCPFFFGK